MEKRGNSLQREIKAAVDKFLEKSKDKEVLVVSHFDTDGITSASIMIQALKALDKKFSVKITKGLDEKFIQELPTDKIVIFLDLASGSLEYIKNSDLKDVFIIDHHELAEEIPSEITLINPMRWDKEKISGSGLTYLFCKEIDSGNKKLAKLAVLGMIGDMVEENMDLLGGEVSKESGIKKKKGILIYPSTRPINRILEYCSQPYIPGVTGNSPGVLELLREAGIEPQNKKYKSFIELDEKENERLVAGIMLRAPKTKTEDIVGDIFLLKFFNKLSDAREISAMINACSRLGHSGVALRFCLESPEARREAEAIHTKYKQHLVSGLDFVSNTEKIEGKGFVIINAKEEILDTIVGTIAGILSKSSVYEEGTVITTMAYYDDKIKVSARNVGGKGRNVREILAAVVDEVGGEVGGHEFAAGCTIKRDQEKKFIEKLKKNLEIEFVKI